MTTQIGASVFVDPTQIRHDITNGNPTLTFGPYPTVRRLDLHLGDVACIDKMIAELVALKQEMDPPAAGCDCMADAPITAEPVISEAQLTAAITAVSDRLPIENLAPHALARRLLLAAQDDPGPGCICDIASADQCPVHKLPTRDELCHYCDVEPATVTLANGRYCEECAPGVQLATGMRFISGSPFCTARRTPDQGGDLCELPLNHDGDHRAPGDDEGDDDITWPAEPASVTA